LANSATAYPKTLALPRTRFIRRIRPAPQLAQQGCHVRRQWRLPNHPLAARRVIDPEDRRVQTGPPGAALVRQRRPVQRPVVDALAAEGRSRLAEVNAHLVGAARLQPALDQRVRPEVFDDADVGHGPLTVGGVGRPAAAPAVAAVADEDRLDPARLR